jgi:predicted PhzF superfamily epimerase YddE/YHI9
MDVYSHHRQIKICGHGLFAVAHYLLHAEERESLILETTGYKHSCWCDDEDIWLELPSMPYRQVAQPQLQYQLQEAGINVTKLLLFPSQVWVAITDSVQEIRDFSGKDFNWDGLNKLFPGALLLSAALPGQGYAYRYFSPWFGKPEDSATGSAHCYLASYWLDNGESAVVQQLSPMGIAEMSVVKRNEKISINGAVIPESELPAVHAMDMSCNS